MPHRTTASYNAMITAYIRNDPTVHRAFWLFTQIPRPNSVSFATMITEFVRAGILDEARRLFDNTPLEFRDPMCSNVLISGYLKDGRLEEAAEVFGLMGSRDVVSWSSMVDGYSKKGGIAKAPELF
ncbi:hypothetical protein MLD38_034140 [Melastoma candidum]|uniref:Uncharacterized protein n=1 Tax=Melastoma candidum TaxID=119954 RepID=A0ACB9MCT9_9MYRT|nr:hypothetical protein MLD38_034140 [Melastoma candidum]